MDRKCTVYRTAGMVGKKWSLLILLEIHRGGGTKRYSELKRNVPGITPKMLSARLKELEREGLVARRVESSRVPVKCEYSLTACGRDFMRVVKLVKEWSLKWKVRRRVCETTECSACRI